MSQSWHDDLNWTAWQYLSGELSAELTEAFEQQLGEDQAACEALAEAVELRAGVAAALGLAPEAASPAVVLRSSIGGLREVSGVGVARDEAGVVSPRSRLAAWSMPAAWMGAGVAAAVAVMLAIQVWLPGAPQGKEPRVVVAEVPAVDPQFASQLASAWLATRAALEGDEEPTSEIGVDDLLEPDVVVAELATPAWLLAAVAHAHGTEPLGETLTEPPAEQSIPLLDRPADRPQP